MALPDIPKGKVDTPKKGAEIDDATKPMEVAMSFGKKIGVVTESVDLKLKDAVKEKKRMEEERKAALEDPLEEGDAPIVHRASVTADLDLILAARTREKSILKPETKEAKITKSKFDIWREHWERTHPKKSEALSKKREQKDDVLTKEWSIALEEQNVSKRVADSLYVVNEKAPPALQEETKRKTIQLKKDLAAYPGDLREFYKEHAEALKSSEGKEKREQIRNLKLKLYTVLNSGKPGKPYDILTVEKIFNALIGKENEPSRSYILNKEEERKRMQTLFNLDPSGRLAKKMDEIIDSDLSEDAKESILGEFFRNVESIVPLVKDPAKRKLLKADFLELKKLKTIRKVVEEAIEKRKADEKLEKTLKLKAAKVAAVAATAAGIYVLLGGKEKAEPLPEQDVALFEDLARTGYPELVLKIISQDDPPLEKIENGLYKAVLGEEEVFLSNQNGEFTVYLEHNNKPIYIATTTPEDTGFDLARSEKVALENNWTEIAKREDLRYALLDAPGDEKFMGSDESKRFGGILTVLLEKEANIKDRLIQLHMIDTKGKVDMRFVKAYKRTLKQWASEEDYHSLAGNTEPADIATLATLLQKQLKDETSIEHGPIFSLEQVRSAEV